MARKHTKDEVLKALRSKNDVQVEDYYIKVLSDTIYDEKNDIIITNPRKKFDLGNSSWGKIDYLKHYHGYSVVHVGSF